MNTKTGTVTGNENIDHLRSFAHVFSTAYFRKLVDKNDTSLILKTARKHLTNISGRPVRQAVNDMYNFLQTHYRNEYVYKNTLLNDLLATYGLESTIVLNEFSVGGSIADFVFLNGEARIYEIKTALDDFSKLEKQITDYRKFANKVYLVTSPEHKNKALEVLTNTNAGIIILGEDNTFNEIRPAQPNTSFLMHETLFKTLRKPEYISLIHEHYGYAPDVSNTRIYRACFELAKKIEINSFQKKTIEILKRRKLAQPNLLQAAATPYELKYLCYVLNLNNNQYNSLYTFLNKTV